MSQQPEALAARLRTAVTDIRRKPYPISDLIPLLTHAADALDELARLHAKLVYANEVIDQRNAMVTAANVEAATFRAQVERLQAACHSQNAESYPQAGLSITKTTQEAADTGADERVRSLLIDAGRTISWQCFGECRAFDEFGPGPVRDPGVVVEEIRAALAASTGANVDAGMVPLTEDEIAKLIAGYFAEDWAIEQGHHLLDHHAKLIAVRNGLTVGGIQANGRVGK